MSKAKTNMIIKRIVDTAMTVLLLSLMAYQVTGEMAHEWIGMGMTVLVIIHQILNRKWYGALICRNAAGKAEEKKNPLLPVVAVMASVIIGIALMLVFPAADGFNA